jgi:hypothetical protein
MSYRDTSNQSGDLSEQAVKFELIRRGWMYLEPSSRDAVYDLVVDRGGYFETIQVKTMKGNSIAKFIDRSSSVVSKNGKVRESIDYAKHGIDWLVGYDKAENKCYFYKLDNYSLIEANTFSVNKYPPDEFPKNDVPKHTRKDEPTRKI